MGAGVMGAESAKGRVEGRTVREEMGSDGVRRALRTGEVFRFSVSKKGSIWKVLSRKGTWSDEVMLNSLLLQKHCHFLLTGLSVRSQGSRI